jgi:hypothetical protein
MEAARVVESFLDVGEMDEEQTEHDMIMNLNINVANTSMASMCRLEYTCA